MMFSSAGSAIVCLTSFAFLGMFWRRCGVCDRPLRWWLLLHAIIQLLQLPVRLVFLTRMRQSRQDRLEHCMTTITSSLAWRTSKNLSLFTYGWFVLGVVWILNAGMCPKCPGIYWITIAVMLQAIARALVALICFRVLFPSTDIVHDDPKVEPATPYEIAGLPLIQFSADLFDEPGASCAVCLSEYEARDMLRKLPCGHFFHQKCAEQWLWRSRKCPLCMSPIDKRPLKSVGAGD